MADDRVHHVTVRLAHDYEFVAEFNDVPGAGPILFDEPAPVGGGLAPSAADMLGAAVGLSILIIQKMLQGVAHERRLAQTGSVTVEE